MEAPTKLIDGDRIYHVGDTITFQAGVRLVGNMVSATTAGFTFQLPIKIGDDVNSFTMENAGANVIKTYGGASVMSSALKNNTSANVTGAIANREYGLLSVVAHFPTWGSFSAQILCYLALHYQSVTTITFGA